MPTQPIVATALAITGQSVNLQPSVITADVVALELTGTAAALSPVIFITVTGLEVTGVGVGLSASFKTKRSRLVLTPKKVTLSTNLVAGVGALEVTSIATPFIYSFSVGASPLELTSIPLIFAPSVFVVSSTPLEINGPNTQLFYRQTWAYNATTSALSRYSIPQAKNLVEHEQRLFILTEDGLYENVGDTDDGANIDAYISTGYIHFNTEELKRFSTGSMFISYDSDNTGQVTLYQSTDGVNNVDQYTTTISSSYPEYFRPPLWDGKKARYWKFRLQNTSGADFKLEDWYVHPYAVSRRIK